jgi:hypothetical protein
MSSYSAQERPSEPGNYSSFVFLSEDVIAVPRQKPFAIELFRLPPTWNIPPPPGCAPAALEVTRTLLLPDTAANIWVVHFSCRSEPNPHTSRKFGRGRTEHFSPNPDEAVVLFHALVRKILMPFIWGEGGSLSFIAHRAALLSFVDTETWKSNSQTPPTLATGVPTNEEDDTPPLAELSDPDSPMLNIDSALPDLASISTTSSEDENDLHRNTRADSYELKYSRIVPWSAWGQRVTRWFSTEDVPTSWITTSCGARFIITSNSDEDAPSEIDVYDFSRNRVQKALRAVHHVAEEGERAQQRKSAFHTGGDVETRIETWIQDGIHPVTPDDSPMPGSWATGNASPTLNPPPLVDLEEDFDAWDDESGTEDLMYLRAGGWSSEEWSLDEHDRVLRPCNEPQQPGEIRLVLGDLPLPRSLAKFFEEEVVSGLPYIVVTKALERNYSSVLMEENCLVGLNVSYLAARIIPAQRAHLPDR